MQKKLRHLKLLLDIRYNKNVSCVERKKKTKNNRTIPRAIYNNNLKKNAQRGEEEEMN